MNSSSRDHEHSTCTALEGWQPIETAPRDGMHILAARFGPSAGIGFGYCGARGANGVRALQPWADVVHWFPGDGDAGGVGGFYSSSWGCDQAAPFKPTHWMPLQAPPSSAAQVPGDSSRDEVKPYEAEVGERQP